MGRTTVGRAARRPGVCARLVADFTQYWVHRTFHAVSLLWRFHAIHHSAEEMDWLAGSRLHLLDVILTRGLTYVPIFVLGFSESALMVYVVLVAAQATFIHANVRWEFRPVRRLVATPAFHHWHHSAEREAVDKNFAVHTPVWDMLFGTYYLPDRWPAAMASAADATFRRLVQTAALSVSESAPEARSHHKCVCGHGTHREGTQPRRSRRATGNSFAIFGTSRAS